MSQLRFAAARAMDQLMDLVRRLKQAYADPDCEESERQAAREWLQSIEAPDDDPVDLKPEFMPRVRALIVHLREMLRRFYEAKRRHLDKLIEQHPGSDHKFKYPDGDYRVGGGFSEECRMSEAQQVAERQLVELESCLEEFARTRHDDGSFIRLLNCLKGDTAFGVCFI